MNNLCHYLCCCGGFKRRYNKNERALQKERTVRQLETLSTMSESTSLAKADDISGVKTMEMTTYYTIPNQNYRTEEDVIGYHRIQLLEIIGSGKFGTVFKAHSLEHKTAHLQLAVKRLKMPESNDKKRDKHMKDIKHELFILSKLKHPHIIRMIEHFVINNKKTKEGSLFIVMQFAPEGDLSRKLSKYGPFNEIRCKQWFAQMLSAMVYVHGMNIAHRDLKTGNIVLDESEDILITDFGLSRMKLESDKNLEASTFCGTPAFMAPELHLLYISKKYGQTDKYDALKVDVWALGVILYNLFSKEYPFGDKDRQKNIKRMQKKKWSFNKKLPNPPSPQLEQFLNMILEPEPKIRPSMKLLSQQLWISEEYKIADKKVKDI